MMRKKTSMENWEDSIMDGDGVVTMRHMKEIKWRKNCLHVKGNMAVRPSKACIPLVTH